MTAYVLAKATAAAATVAAALASGQAQVVNPSAGQAPINPQTQTFHAVVAGTSGNVSATVQPYVSNDGVNWSAYGSAITIASGATPQQGVSNGTSPWQFYTAVVTAITGTGAVCTVTMGV
ncbi:MAG: hypothetical protein PVS3B2_00250 [Candidatus Dormibacteraceae bacterium]